MRICTSENLEIHLSAIGQFGNTVKIA